MKGGKESMTWRLLLINHLHLPNDMKKKKKKNQNKHVLGKYIMTKQEVRDSRNHKPRILFIF